jgi:hypothetical protein
MGSSTNAETSAIEIPTPESPGSLSSEPKEDRVIEALYSPSEEASQLPAGAGGEGDDVIANEPSVFDDPNLAKFYWPRNNYEGLHRFFPDFKWTVSEEKK